LCKQEEKYCIQDTTLFDFYTPIRHYSNVE